MSVVGSYNLDAAYPVRAGEGCDRYGNPFSDEEPVEGTRNYGEPKHLRDRHQANTLSYGDQIVKLTAMLRERYSDREPLMISSGRIRGDGEHP